MIDKLLCSSHKLSQTQEVFRNEINSFEALNWEKNSEKYIAREIMIFIINALLD